MAKQKFYVIRSHIGDKEYNVGDERMAEKRDVEHLIGTSLSIEKPKKNSKRKADAAPKVNNPTNQDGADAKKSDLGNLDKSDPAHQDKGE